MQGQAAINNQSTMKINLSSIKNPRNPSFWSGTPYNIWKVLNDRNQVADSFATDNKGLITQLFKFTGSMYFGIPRHWERRGRIVRGLNAHHSYRKTAASSSKHTLHFGMGDLPFWKKPKDQFHYIYCDSTWNLWHTYSTLKHLYSKKIAYISEKLDKLAFDQATHIFCTSRYVKENLIQHYQIDPSKITVVGTGAGIIKPYTGPKDYSNQKILFAAKGRFQDKGGDLVLEAFSKIVKRLPNLQLSIVGQNDYTRTIQHPNITTYGFVPVEKMQELFNTHSLFVMPALNEPWGLVYIEAMLCKMPIIGLNRNSFPELSDYGKCGIGLEKADSTQLAEVLHTLISDPGKLEKMGSHGQSYAMNTFTWENTTEKIFSHIQF